MYFFGETYFKGIVLKNTFQILLSAVLLIDFVLLIITTLNNRKTPGKKTGKDRGSMLLIIAGFFFVILINPLCVQTFAVLMPEYIFWVGAFFMVFGIVTRVYSVWTLRKYFTFTVQVGNEQKLIQNGPYKYLRHPAYTGSILSLLGISLCFRSPIGVIATLIITTVIYGYRIKIEEAALEQNFGGLYQKYKDHTYRVIPYIW